MKSIRLFVTCLILSMVVLTINIVSLNASIFKESLVNSENGQNKQDIVWSKIYNGTDSDAVDALVQTSDGGFVLTGDIYTKDWSVLMVKTGVIKESIGQRIIGLEFFQVLVVVVILATLVIRKKRRRDNLV